MAFIVIIILMIVMGIIIALVNQAKNKKAMSEYISMLPNFSVTNEYMGEDGKTGLAYDEKNKKVCLIEKHGKKIIGRIFEYRDILSSELCEDGTTITKTSRSSQLGGALLGGIIFGPLGAVVGGLSGKKKTHSKVKRIDLQVVVNDTNNPTHIINFMNVETKKGGLVYKQAMNKAKYWTNVVEVLIRQADRRDQDSDVQTSKVGEINIAKEIRELAELRNSGILSEEEFQIQKQKLLDK